MDIFYVQKQTIHLSWITQIWIAKQFFVERVLFRDCICGLLVTMRALLAHVVQNDYMSFCRFFDRLLFNMSKVA